MATDSNFKAVLFDDLGNNSMCRSFAIIQGKLDQNIVNSIMAPGTVPERLGIMVSLRETDLFPGNQS